MEALSNDFQHCLCWGTAGSASQLVASLKLQGKQCICMHKEEKEKSRDTCVSGRFYKTLIKAGLLAA